MKFRNDSLPAKKSPTDSMETYDKIKTLNPKYDIDKLKLINGLSITEDSQQQLNIPYENNPIYDKIFKSQAENWRIQPESLKNIKYQNYYQKPYLELSTSTKNGTEIYNAFKNNIFFGIEMLEKGKKLYKNKVIQELKIETEQVFNLKECIALTYYKLEHPVMNQDNRLTEWLSVTNHWLNKLEHVYESYKTTQFFPSYKKSIPSFIFIVGVDYTVDINEMFDIIINCC